MEEAMSRFCTGSLKSAKMVGNINIAESIKITESNLLAYQKGLINLGQVVVWIIHLYLSIPVLLNSYFA